MRACVRVCACVRACVHERVHACVCACVRACVCVVLCYTEERHLRGNDRPLHLTLQNGVPPRFMLQQSEARRLVKTIGKKILKISTMKCTKP